MSRNILPFLKKSFTKKEAHIFPVVGLVGSAVTIGAYYFVRHAINSPELVVSKSQREAYAKGDMSEHVPERDPTFSALHSLKNKPISAFDNDPRYSMKAMHGEESDAQVKLNN